VLRIGPFFEGAAQECGLDDRLTFLGFAPHEVECVNVALSTNAMNTAQSLLEARRFPRQVVVDHQSAELERAI
jgi:hypothetical protein